MTHRRRAEGIGLAVVVMLLAAGCGSSTSGSTQGPTGSAQSPTVSLVRAADVSTATAGYRATMVLHETVPSVGSIDLTANGSFSPAAHAGAMSMHMRLPPSAGLGTLQLQVVLSRTAIYMKLPPQLASKIPGGKPWIYINLDQIGKAAGIPGLGSLVGGTSSLSDPGQYLSFVRATSARTVKDLGRATVNGLPTTRYHAELDLAKLPAAVPAAQRPTVRQLVAALEKKGAATQIPVDAWLDSSHLIRRLHMTFSEPLGTTGQSAAIALTENFLQYGPQPAPAVPNGSQTVNLLSLTQG